jgi:DNA-3-methyladenine glycosylase I
MSSTGDSRRCAWAGTDALMVCYHDKEWGVPLHDDRKLFELLTLEGAQAGLSWQTILRRREGYRRAFVGFDLGRVAAFGETDVQRLLSDTGIIRNRGKIRSTIANARAALDLIQSNGSFDGFLWSFVGGTPNRNAFSTLDEIPSLTMESLAMSKDLKRRGFRFVGPTICYAFMQSAGLVNDHETSCFRYDEV